MCVCRECEFDELDFKMNFFNKVNLDGCETEDRIRVWVHACNDTMIQCMDVYSWFSSHEKIKLNESRMFVQCNIDVC